MGVASGGNNQSFVQATIRRSYRTVPCYFINCMKRICIMQLTDISSHPRERLPLPVPASRALLDVARSAIVQ